MTVTAPTWRAFSAIAATSWMIGRLEEDVREVHDRRPLVDRVDQSLGVDRIPSSEGTTVTSAPTPALLVDQVEDRREVHGVGDDPVGGASTEIERAEDDGMGQRHVGLEDDLARPRSDQRGDEVAEVGGHGPPAVLPGPDAARWPRSRNSPEELGRGACGTAPSELLIR